jgi:hypothetical protein
MTKITQNEKLMAAQTGLTFVQTQIAQFESMIFTLNQQLNQMKANRDRLQAEIDQYRKGK